MKSQIPAKVALVSLSVMLVSGIFSCTLAGFSNNKKSSNQSTSANGTTISPAETVVYIKNSTNPERNSLDIYKSNNVNSGIKSPIIIFVHGGGFRNGDKSRVRSKPSYFTQKGFAFISINYRLAASERRDNTNPVQHPAQIQDVAAAIAWVHDHANEFGGDPNKIFLMGHSAGAHLVALVSTDERYLKAHNLNLSVIKGTIGLDTGLYDLAQVTEDRTEGSRIIANAFGNNPKVWQDASPISHVERNKNIPPFLLTYTTQRKETINENFANLLKGAGVPVVLIDSRGKTHEEINAEIGVANNQLTESISRFLDSILQNKTIKAQIQSLNIDVSQKKELASTNLQARLGAPSFNLSFSKNYNPGTKDRNGQFMGGTEN